MGKKYMKNTNIDKLSTETSPTDDENIIAHQLNQFFSNFGKNVYSKIKKDPDVTPKLDPRENSVFLESTTEQEVLETIKRLKKKN